MEYILYLAPAILVITSSLFINFNEGIEEESYNVGDSCIDYY